MLTLCRITWGIGCTLAGIAWGIGLVFSGRPGLGVLTLLALCILGALFMPELDEGHPDGD